jgi:hypothetical protein
LLILLFYAVIDYSLMVMIVEIDSQDFEAIFDTHSVMHRTLTPVDEKKSLPAWHQ